MNFLNGKAYKQQELLDSGKYRVLRAVSYTHLDVYKRQVLCNRAKINRACSYSKIRGA
nr:hypothetical protein [Enterococcus sp. 9E7_DIV0242]